MNRIDPTLEPLAVDIDSLVPLDGNPRKGNVDAIMASYREFGQVRPIVVRPNGDGTSTVIAGNHQLEAAKRLGWDKIAAVQYEVDEQQAVAFALADNRTSELGHSEPEALDAIIEHISAEYVELLEGLGWDEFELAALGEQADRLNDLADDPLGYIPPVIIPIDERGQPPITREVTPEGERIVPTGEVDSKSVAATGSTSIGQSGSKQAVVQYTLVFDSADQQKRWYDFIRWLRSDPGHDGNTTAERLMDFVESHADF